MDDSERREMQALDHLKRIEIRFHIAKLIVIIMVSIATAVSVIYFIHKDNDRTRGQINCIVDGFLQPNAQDVANAVHKCRR